MKVSNTSKRLKHIMQLRNLKQVDVLNLAKPYCEKYDTKLTKVDLKPVCIWKSRTRASEIICTC